MIADFGDFVDLTVHWRDETRYGSLLSHRLSDTIRETLHPRTWAMLAGQMRKSPPDRTKFSARELCALIFEERRSETYRRITSDQSFWRPDAGAVRIEGFSLHSEECDTSITISAAAGDCSTIRAWLRTGEAPIPALMAFSKRLAASIGGGGFQRVRETYSGNGPQMVGHACVTWSDREVRLWIDPYLRPKRLRYPLGQQPMSPLDVPEKKHVVLITHSHPDHFSPESLLLFPADTTIIVPHTNCEDILTIDMALRARQLGFEDVNVLAWHDHTTVGEFRIVALPFFGEQPLGPYAAENRIERNCGSTYHISGPNGLTALFLADSGSDPCGSALRMARHVHRAHGNVDVVFGNHRRWRVSPPQYLTTSVPQYICFVPDSELGIPQAMMLTPEELEVIGEALSARFLVPYAMGNAPWFAEIGLGPDSDNSNATGLFDSGLSEHPAIDDPDSLVIPAAQVTPLSPGDHIGPRGRWRDPSREPIDPTRFSRRSVVAARSGRAMAIGGLLGEHTVRDLLTLTSVAPDAYLVAAPGFLEIIAREAGEAEFLWNLALRLIGNYAWISFSSTPFIAGAFATHHVWMSLFDHFHRLVGRVMRDDNSDLIGIKPILDELRAGVPSEAIETIARELLGISIHVAREVHQTREEAAFGSIELPPAASTLVRTYGSSSVARALLVVKLVHNIALTRRAIGCAESGDEAHVFNQLLSTQCVRQTCG